MKSKPSKQRSQNSGTNSTETEFKTLRYKLQSKEEEVKLAQLTQKMYAMGILKEVQPGMAAKVIMEIVLTTNIIDSKKLLEYKLREQQY